MVGQRRLHDHGAGIVVALDAGHAWAAQSKDTSVVRHELRLTRFVGDRFGTKSLRCVVVVIVPPVPRRAIQPAPVDLGVSDRCEELLLELDPTRGVGLVAERHSPQNPRGLVPEAHLAKHPHAVGYRLTCDAPGRPTRPLRSEHATIQPQDARVVSPAVRRDGEP